MRFFCLGVLFSVLLSQAHLTQRRAPGLPTSVLSCGPILSGNGALYHDSRSRLWVFEMKEPLCDLLTCSALEVPLSLSVSQRVTSMRHREGLVVHEADQGLEVSYTLSAIPDRSVKSRLGPTEPLILTCVLHPRHQHLACLYHRAAGSPSLVSRQECLLHSVETTTDS